MRRATSALALSTLSGVAVESPTAGLTKPEIVRKGVEVGAPLAHVWSCYEAGPWMCGACESCARLVRALEEAEAPAGFRPRLLPSSAPSARAPAGRTGRTGRAPK
jgi:7-cyano-7-deazaguanine synthase in queuosine biosynthesis